MTDVALALALLALHGLIFHLTRSRPIAFPN